MPAQEFQIADLDRMAATNGAYDARYRIGVTTAIQCRAGVVQVDAIERGGKSVGIAFAPDLTIGDDVQASAFLRLDRHDGGVFLGFGQVGLGYAPEFTRSHARWKAAGQSLAGDQPLRLRVASYERGGKQHGHRSNSQHRRGCARAQATQFREPARRG